METFTANSGGTTGLDSLWSGPERLDVLEFEDRIEMIFKETSMITSTIWPSLPPATRVFKIVFSCEKRRRKNIIRNSKFNSSLRRILQNISWNSYLRDKRSGRQN